jgi:N utilization substance protein A
MVGQKGTRVMAVINELGGEKIDIIEYSPEPDRYIANALSPAKVLEVKVLPKNKAQVSVPEDQLSLAIGKNGQNVRLAAKLTGWKIDVQSPTGEVVSSEELLGEEEPKEEAKEEALKEIVEEKPKKIKKIKKVKKEEKEE